MAWSTFDELRTYNDIKLKYGYGNINTTLPDDVTRALRRAYYAAISYTDSLVNIHIQNNSHLSYTKSLNIL